MQDQTSKIKANDILIKKLLVAGKLLVRDATVLSRLGRTFNVFSRGYKRVSVRVNGKRVYLFEHRVLCIHYHGLPKNHAKLQVNHKDGNKKNNKQSNIEWSTPLANTHHAINSRLRNMLGEDHPRCVYTDAQVLSVIKYIEIGKKFSAISKLTKIPLNVITLIASGKLRKHLLPSGFITRTQVIETSKKKTDKHFEKYMTTKAVCSRKNLNIIMFLLATKRIRIDYKRRGNPAVLLNGNLIGPDYDVISGCASSYGSAMGVTFGHTQAFLMAHQIVAIDALGCPPPRKTHVGFIDGNKLNYRKNNLYWKA